MGVSTVAKCGMALLKVSEREADEEEAIDELTYSFF